MHVLGHGLGCFCHVFRPCATIFGTVRFFSEKIENVLGAHRPRLSLLRLLIIYTPADIFSRARMLF